MDDEEMLFKQVQITAAATKGTTVWVYRNTVYGYPWYGNFDITLGPILAYRYHRRSAPLCPSTAVSLLHMLIGGLVGAWNPMV